MKIFGIGRKKERKKRQLTDEQKLHKVDLKVKKYAGKALLEMAEKDPEIKRQMVAETFGFKLPDSYGEPQRKLKALIDDLVIRRIEEEPELARKIAEAKVYQVMTAEGLTRDSEEMRNRPSAMNRFTTQMEEVRRLKEVMGIKEPGFLGAFAHPEVLKSIFSLIPAILSSILGGKDTPNTGEATVLVQLNGEMKQITMSEFEKLKKDGRVKLVGAEEPPKSSGSNNPGETHSKLG